MTDWGELYRDHVTAVSALVTDLTDEQRAQVVPGTPAWTVQDVVAHLAGGAADVTTGRMDGAPGPEWTSRHVAERSPLPVAALLDELRTHQDGIAASTVDNPRPAIVWDIAVHHADLHEGLGLGRMPGRLWEPVAQMIGPWRAPELVDRVDPYELFRGVFSRRSRAQIQGWDVGADPDALGIFGARDDDQPVPA